jgi:hypothetical protein
MLANFDPKGDRQSWLERNLDVFMRFAPHQFDREAMPLYLHTLVNNAAECYFLGLADQVRPVLEAVIDWIETHPEPRLHEYSKERHHWQHIWTLRFWWYQTFGLCKWLSRGDAAEAEFATAIKAEIDAREHALKETLPLDPGDEQATLTERVATALAARNPAVGLTFLAAVGVAHASEPEAPVLEFSQWACHHLASGGKRDAEFVERGAKMLQATLLPYFFWGANRTEPALWLKAIYWDSGMVRTPEQVFARAYDSMPGIERPDFVPG